MTPAVRTWYKASGAVVGSGAMRPGYIPYYPWQSAWTTNADAHFNLNHTNEMALGGMDNILVWYPQSIGTNREYRTNELWMLLTAYNALNGFAVFDHRAAYGHCMVRIEGKQAVPGAAILSEGINRHNTVVNSCLPEKLPAGVSNPKFAALRSGDDMASTREPLSVSAEWYRSRRMVRSLVAWRDRGSATLAGKYLSPYLAYLRYHQGDVLFMRTVLSTLDGLRRLEQSWDQMLRNPSQRSKFDAAGANLLTILGLSGWSSATQKQALVDAAPGWLTTWRTNNVTYHASGTPPLTETTWRHVGLIAAMRAADPANPLLASIPAVVTDPALLAVADTALDAVEMTTAMGLWPAIDCVLQYTPIQKLLDAKVHSFGKGASRRGRREFVAQISKAENFERRVRYYEFVRSVAGVDAAAH
jgi:hypothetical protein